MLVKFVLLSPGNHHEIGKTKMVAVPRQGEYVTIDEKAHAVHSVDWNLTEMSVTILLRE